ncbi:MAG: SPOR domain-containing protein [Spirochaetaceae bacterium]|jgi:DedD protein|nr:SPOR domain-containing protein [Spirochaetaceae bacterium]
MEKKKILLVTVSVGIFLVIAIGAAILLFTPGQAASGSAVVMQPGAAGTATIQRPAPPPAVPAGETDSAAGIFEAPPAAENFYTGQTGEPPASPAETRFTEENYFVIDAEPAGSAPPAGAEGQVRISVARPQPAAAPGVPAAQPRQAPARTEASPRPAQEAPRSAAQSAPRAAAPPASRPSGGAASSGTANSAAASRSAGTARSNNRAWTAYWVQAGSFSSMNRADSAKESLAARGITSIVENNELNGKIWYRVRVGPYTSQNEADYWLALIQTLQGFEQSQVWRSPVVN